MLIIDFEDDLNTDEITETIRRIRTDVKNEFKLVHYVIIPPESGIMLQIEVKTPTGAIMLIRQFVILVKSV